MKIVKYCQVTLGIIVMTISIVACRTKGAIDKIIIDSYEQNCQSDTCIFRSRIDFGFQWDTLYYFSESASVEDIEATLHQPLHQYRDVGRRYIFTRQGKVIHYEEQFPSFDGLKQGDVIIALKPNTHSRVFGNKIITIAKVESEGRYFYRVG